MKKIINIFLIVTYVFIFSSCKKEAKGYNLQKFQTINKGLLDIIDFADSINGIEYRKKTLVLELKV